MSTRPQIDEDLTEALQKYANEYFDGNFTAAVNAILRASLGLS